MKSLRVDTHALQGRLARSLVSQLSGSSALDLSYALGWPLTSFLSDSFTQTVIEELERKRKHRP